MMAKRRDWHEELCVLRVNSDVSDSPGTIVTSQNASSDYCCFPGSTPEGLAIVEHVVRIRL